MNVIGCYGSVICHDDKNEVCGTCDLFSQCHDIAHKSLMSIRSEIDVEHIARRFQQDRVRSGKEIVSTPISSNKRVELSEYQKAIVSNDRLPVKVRNSVESLFRKGIDGAFIRKSLSNGSNPFRESPPAALEVACDLLISGNLSVRSMVTMLNQASDRRLNQKTVKSQATTAIRTLMVMSAIVSADGEYILRGA